MKIDNTIKDSLKKIADEYELDLIILFGSRARNQIHKDSDTDIAIRGQKKMSLNQILEISTRLSECFPSTDVADIRAVSPLLLGAIAKDAVLLFERKQSLFSEFRVYAINMFMDFQPYFDLRRKKQKDFIDNL